jgi:hypothetical protein
MSLKASEGTITFWARHDHPDWATNNSGYDFSKTPSSETGVHVESMKNPNKTVTVIAYDGTGCAVEFTKPMPTVSEKGLFVCVTWDWGQVKLYLNAKLIEEKSVP